MCDPSLLASVIGIFKKFLIIYMLHLVNKMSQLTYIHACLRKFKKAVLSKIGGSIMFPVFI